MELSILCFKGLQVKISKSRFISVPKDCFISANSAHPDEMQLCACLPVSKMSSLTGGVLLGSNSCCTSLVTEHWILVGGWLGCPDEHWAPFWMSLPDTA